MQSAVISSEDTTLLNNNFKDEVSVVVDIEVDELAAKLEKDGALGRFIMSVGSCNHKNGQYLDYASINVVPAKVMTDSTESMTDDSDVEVENLDDFDASNFDVEEMLE